MASVLPYSDVQQGTVVPQEKQPIAPPSQMPTQLRFPTSFTIENTSVSNFMLTEGLETGRVRELHYISTHNAWSSKPDVVLHSSADPSSPSLSTASFKAFSSTITLNCGPETTEIHKNGVFTPAYIFSVYIPQTNQKEAFEWKKTSGNEVQVLGVSSSGMKCVRAGTGEVVAVYAGVRMSFSKKGKMAFLGAGARGELGGNWDLMAVISLLGIQVKLRRTNNAVAVGSTVAS